MLKPSWHETRTAGRVGRHLGILRDIAHELSPNQEREDLPADFDAERAQATFEGFLEQNQQEAPRAGLGAATGAFVDRIVKVYRRYGAHLFACFDDPRIPPNTNGLEKFFGVSKSQLRHALGTGSTSNGVAQNLGGDYLTGLAYALSETTERLVEALAGATVEQFEAARRSIAAAEAPATMRRSRRRRPQHHLDDLLERWLASP